MVQSLDLTKMTDGHGMSTIARQPWHVNHGPPGVSPQNSSTSRTTNLPTPLVHLVHPGPIWNQWRSFEYVICMMSVWHQAWPQILTKLWSSKNNGTSCSSLRAHWQFHCQFQLTFVKGQINDFSLYLWLINGAIIYLSKNSKYWLIIQIICWTRLQSSFI